MVEGKNQVDQCFPAADDTKMRNQVQNKTK